MADDAAPLPSLPQLAPLGKFDFSNINDWPRWMKRFDRYRIASGLDRQSEEFQVNAFMYAAGDDAEDILNVLPLTDVQKQKYKDVTDAFNAHCVGKRNVIYERARFNRRDQEPGESVESFLTAAHTYAEHCQFGALREELIRDRIVVGIRDAKLSESLQMDADLTLEKAMTRVRQSAAIKKQQPTLRGTEQQAAAQVEAIQKHIHLAEWKRSISNPSSVSENMTSLARALSHPKLNHIHIDHPSESPFTSSSSQTNLYRGNVSGRRRNSNLSSSTNLNDSVESISPCAEARVLVINTGGTIGMTLRDNVLAPKANAFVENLRKLPILHDEHYAQQTCLYDYYDKPENILVLPLHKNNKRIVYSIMEYSPLLDSCNMTTDDWGRLGKDIEKNYENYDGFVILHGTDTMAYTASALSFMCENLGKPIILTGSQVPIYEMRNDGRDNLLGALLIAGQFVIPEVCLYFYNKLYRGNRVTKVDAGSFNAFNSPNLAPLANAEVDIIINWDTVWRANTTAKFHVSTELNRNVGLLRLFPGITAATVRAFLQPPMEGVVLETYGSGNCPDNRADLLEELKKATDRGVIIINCTQCLRGSVSTSYATGKVLIDAGLITGSDMTPEAALSKMSYVLAKSELDLQAKKKMMEKNLRGEMIADLEGAKLSLSDSRFIQVIAKTLSVSCKEELEAIRDALTPPLACAAAKIGDVEALEAIREMGSILSLGDYDGRTPLHIAACEGHLKVVQYLLSHGATVYAKDRYGDTPLRNAVRFRHMDVVKLLRKTGAHFSRDELEEAGTELCKIAAIGDLEGLEIWSLAGADLNKPGYDGQTASGVAQALGNKEVVMCIKQLMSPKAQNVFDEFNEYDEYDDDENGGVIEFKAPPSGC